MVSVDLNPQNVVYLSNFSRYIPKNSPVQSNAERKTLTDQFMQSVQQQVDKDTNGDWEKKYFGGRTAVIPIIASYIYAMGQLGSMVGVLKHQKGKLLPTLFKSARNIAIVTTAGMALTALCNKYLNSKSDENYDKLKHKFNEINTNTSAELADKMVCSGVADAMYNPMSGKILFSKDLVNDPIIGRNLDKKIKHELVHAKQYETVARSKDGIKKVNYAVVRNLSNNLQNNEVKEYFNQLFIDIQSSGNKYDNVKMKIIGGAAEVNVKDYIVAIHTMLNKSDATYNDIPIVIDSEHYQKVINEKGVLSQEEEIKADEYYRAMLDYKPVGIIGALNPWSEYRQNLLEKEAYKENPSLITKLSYMFNKE